MTIEEAKQYILEGGKITEEQALSLANHPDKEALYEASTPNPADAPKIVNGAHNRDITRPS